MDTSCKLLLSEYHRTPVIKRINIGSGNGLVPSGNKPLPGSMLTHILGHWKWVWYIEVWYIADDISDAFSSLKIIVFRLKFANKFVPKIFKYFVWIFFYLDFNFSEVCSCGSNWQWINIGIGNGLAPEPMASWYTDAYMHHSTSIGSGDYTDLLERNNIDN